MRWRPGPVVPFTFGLTDRVDGIVWYIIAETATERLAITTDQPFIGHIKPHIFGPFSEPVLAQTDLILCMEDGRLCFEELPPEGRAARRVLPYERTGMKAVAYELLRLNGRLGYEMEPVL